MYDYHMHTNYSCDCSFSLEDMIQGAIKKGMKEICITDHIDLNYPDEDEFIFDVEDYIKDILNKREIYKDQISIRIGVEFGLQDNCIEDVNKIINNHNLDFVLCSFHVCEGHDLYHKKLLDTCTPLEGMKKYLSSIREILNRFNNFDVIGHINLPIRYYKEIAALDVSLYEVDLDATLKSIIDLGKGIEINTSGYRYNNGEPYPNFEIVKRFIELGGEIITFASDAHFPDHIGYNYDIVKNELKSIGVNWIYRFENRKAIKVIL